MVDINGNYSKWINPTRGMRQGDSLSPYLFIMYVYVLSSLLIDSQRRGNYNRLSYSQERPCYLSPFLCADDSLIFCKAREEEANELYNIFGRYKRASGQLINDDKLVMVFSTRVPYDTKDQIRK